MSKTILIIEDDRVILKFLTLALKTSGYEVKSADTGVFGLGQYYEQNIDLVLLDLGLPDMDGMGIIKNIRAERQTPIIVISARGREKDKVDALDSGANDYVTKPFNIGEVLARVRAVLRTTVDTNDLETFEYKDLTIDFERHEVKVSDQEVHLTPIEFKLLELLVKHQGKVLTHSFIHEHVWGYRTVDDYQSLRVFMASIRKKIEPEPKSYDYILTEIGVGYRFKDD